jgi:sigma-B regulation protein RsbU (phosphoserine phosphatase)
MPLKEAGWGIGVYFSDRDFLAGIEAATRFKLLFTLAMLILLASILALVSLRSLKPLGELADRTRAIAKGNFRGDTPGMTRKDEIGSLSRAFHTMQEQLQHYVEDLTRATTARERMDAELATARRIHHALLPNPKPDVAQAGLELEALLHPAREVGGDLYNYTRLEDGRLFFVIGDVSDKGVPAALFMSRANALLRAAAAHATSPSAVLETVNEELCEDNELCMFVTLLAGTLSLHDGSLQLASAGHDSPIRVSVDGQVEVIEVPSSSPAGINEDARYVTVSSRLNAGDALVTFTDGVTEARNPERGLLGMSRLLDILATAGDNAPHNLLQAITTGVEDFANGSEQADDLTLLVLRYPGAAKA